MTHRVFPREVQLGRLASAKLVGVNQSGNDLVGRYDLEPVSGVDFVARIGGLKGRMGTVYEPLKGVWVTYAVPKDRDVVELRVGLRGNHGRGLSKATQALKVSGEALVPPFQVRALALSFLDAAGV